MTYTHEALEEILEVAAGQDISEEIARLRTMLRLAGNALLPSQRQAFLACEETMMTLESALCEDGAAPAKDVEALISAARTHGEDSEPDMEPGDLQAFLRTAYGTMSPEQRTAFINSIPEGEKTLDAAARSTGIW